MVIVLSAFITRTLSPADAGAFFLAYSVVWVLAIVGRGGLDQVAVREVSVHLVRDETRELWAAVAGVLTLSSTFLVVIGIGIWVGGGKWLSATVFRSTALGEIPGLLAAWVIIVGLQFIVAEILRGFHDIRLASIFASNTIFGGVLSSMLVALCFVALWAAGLRLDLHLAVATVVGVAAAVGILSAWLLASKLRGLGIEKAGGVKLGALSRAGMPLLFASLSTVVLLHGDMWILGAFLADRELAVYAVATRMVKLVAMALIVTNEVLAPIIAELDVMQRRETLERALRGTATLSSVPAVGVVLVFLLSGEDVLGGLFGEHYRSGAAVLGWLSMGHLVVALTGSCGYTLVMTGYGKVLMMIAVGASAVMVVGGVIVVPYFGVEGMAAVVAVSIAIQNVAMLIAARFLCGVWTHASLFLLLPAWRELGVGRRKAAEGS